MDSEDDEKRRVMTPPESWSSSSIEDSTPDTLGDDSWLNDDELIPGMDEVDKPDSAEPAAMEMVAEKPVDAAEPAADVAPEPVPDIIEAPAEPEPEPAPDVEEPTLSAAPDDTAVLGDDDWLGDVSAAAEQASNDSAASIGPAPDPVDDAMLAAMAAPAPEPTNEPTPMPEPAPAPSEDPTPGNAAAATPANGDEETAPRRRKRKRKSTDDLLTDHDAAAESTSARKLPIWVIASLGVGLLLIVGGGWGVFQDRSGLTARITQLEGELAAAKRQSSGDLSAAEEQALNEDNQSLRLQLNTLRDQYATMASELDQIQAMVNQSQAANQASAAPAPAANAETDTQPPAENAEPLVIPAPAGGEWFVNVASYSRRDIAEEWADKLEAEVGSIQLQEVMVDGKPLFRVRAIGYANRAAAQAAANALETRYGIGPLWVGRDPDLAGNGQAATTSTTATSPVVALRDTAANAGGWFVFVDTYSRGVDADSRARAIRDAGYDAKVAVESRQGELFYRVQVVGINSEAEGEATLKALAQLDDMPNLQLRRY